MMFYIPPGVQQTIEPRAQNPEHYMTVHFSGSRMVLGPDKIGVHKIIMTSLIVAGVLYIPQAFVQNPWQLLVLRFLLGFAMGGLIPSVSIMIKKITPDFLTGRIFGFNMSIGYLGVAVGSTLGGQIAGRFSFQYVFYITSTLMFINAVWVYFRVYKKWDKVVLNESLGKE